MRRRTVAAVGALGLALIAGVLFVACGGPLGPAGPTPASVALRQPDMPAGWTRCGWSGSIASYLPAARRASSSAAVAPVEQSWNRLRKHGATAAQVTSFVADASDCSRAFGHSGGSSASTFTIGYGSAAEAHHGYESGVLGYPTPRSGQVQPGLQVGGATGLSDDSWTLTQTAPAPPLFIAWWREGSLTTFLVVAGLPEASANPIALRVDARMNG